MCSSDLCDWNYMDNEVFGLTDSVTGAKSDGDQNDWYADHVGEGEFYLCLRVKDNAKPGKSTITVKANGATLTTFSVTVYGDLDSLTLSAKRGYTNVAEGNSEIDAFFTVVGKDSAGQTINAKGDGLDIYLNDYTDNAVTQAGTDDGEVIEDAQGDTMNFVDNSFDFEQTLDLLSSVCDEESYDDAGDGDDGDRIDHRRLDLAGELDCLFDVRRQALQDRVHLGQAQHGIEGRPIHRCRVQAERQDGRAVAFLQHDAGLIGDGVARAVG